MTTKINTEPKSDATQPSITNDVERFFVPSELSSVSESTHATLHVVQRNIEGKVKPLSARVHIETPNPTVDEVDATLTTPNHVCCVIDISGSMCALARSKDEDGNAAEDLGLEILDIVKFSTLVIAQSLNPQDKLSIITYSNTAFVVLPPTHMTLDGKELVKTTLATITSFMRTNLFAGVQLGIMQAHDVGNEFINSVFVLTDGYPNIHPDLGYEVAIAKVLADTPIFGAISTFGFGYNLDSKLLADIAKIGGGYYSFIPDAGMVGTCFINALANSRCAFGVNPTLKISGCDFTRLAKSRIVPRSFGRRYSIISLFSSGKRNKNEKDKTNTGLVVPGLTVDGCLETTLLDNDIYIKLTPLRYGSNVDVMLRPELFKQITDISIELLFETVGGNIKKMNVSPADGDAADELYHSKRAQFVNDAINISFNPFKDTICNIFFDATLEGAAVNSNLDALYQDMKGQATEAIARDTNFKSWGKHFLLSLSIAHLHQFCNNFKDPGVQVYGTGLLFSSLQDSLDDIFEQIPPPVPQSALPPGTTVQMSKIFNNRNAVCVHGKTIVTVKRASPHKTDGCNSSSVISSIPIRNIQKGDFVLTANGSYVKVDCLVETVADDKTPFELIKVGQLCVTPYHPVKVEEHSGWQFPIQISHSKWMLPDDDQYTTANTVYNLVLERGHRHKAVIMDGIESITLGHGITNDTTLHHSYFGTDNVVSDLEILQDGISWKTGHIVLRENNVKRDPSSGSICHISEMKVAREKKMTIENSTFSCIPCGA